MNQNKFYALSLFTLFVFLLIAPCTGLAAETFSRALMLSESRQYSSDWYSFPNGHPFSNDNPVWFMTAYGATLGDAPFPVTLNSTQTGPVTLSYLGPWGTALNLSATPFMPSPIGSYKAPGGDWENVTYTFTVGDATATWNFPAGSLQQLPAIAPVTATAGEHPTFTWNAVAGADAYDFVILDIDYTRTPQFARPLFVSAPFADDGSPTFSYTYTGDLFAQGIDYPVWIRALQFHPLSGSDARYHEEVLNRSTHVMKHRGHATEDLSTWTLEENVGANFYIDDQDSARFFFNCTSTDGANSDGYLHKSLPPDAIGMIADVTVLTTTTTGNSEWGAMGLRANLADTPQGTMISAQIRAEWSGGSQRIQCRLREHKADGSVYRDLMRVNQHYGWTHYQTVPMGVAVVNKSVVFWAEGRGLFAVPLPDDVIMRSDDPAIFMSIDPGAMEMSGMVDNVRVVTKDNPMVFGAFDNVCDINGDGKIGLEEAIGALQAVSAVGQP
ncbi:MAG: hypothetical protein JEZ02_03745 [Desulfatibacillum sp.]|nr:hypothetical protein [Desulfatibacillum sp.]